MSSDAFYAPATHAFEEQDIGEPAAEAGPSSMGDAAAGLSLDAAFDIDSTARLVLEGGHKTIGLQFPDELLPSSVAVYRALQSRIGASGAQAYVLADSTYGACCPDILSCLHLPADMLVHYGHACLTPTDAIPVHYVFPRRALDSAAAAAALSEVSATDFADGKKGAIVVWDVAYDWLADDIVKDFTAAFEVPVSFATIQRPQFPSPAESSREGGESKAELANASSFNDTGKRCPSSTCSTNMSSSCCAAADGLKSSCRPEPNATQQPCCAPAESTCCSESPAPAPARSKGKAPALRRIEPPTGIDLADCIVFYLGDEGRSLLNLQMTHATNPVYAYTSERGAWPVHPGSSRFLSRRLYAVHQAMGADVFGLVVGNIGLAASRPLVAELREALRLAKKKSYTLSVGRLNPAKLANFAEIECFVLVGCAEGGIVDSKDFMQPIVTPYELTLALKGKQGEWDPSAWTLDLGAALDAATQQVETQRGKSWNAAGQQDADGDDSDSELEFSLVTGTYRTRRTFGDTNSGQTTSGTDLTLRNQEFSLAKLESAGSMHLQSRSFQGLEPRYGMDEPATLEQGRSGIARGYTEEK